MKLEGKVYKLVLVIVAAVMFCGVSQMQQALNHDRVSLGFTKLPPLRNAPPILAFTTGALGGFRGLIVNALVMRSVEMQDQEKYFEMVQLADWITKLEPHYVQVWINSSWNLSFNISVKFADFSDRWRWVSSGLNLLRQGLDYNPDEAMIYREMAWMYLFKIGGIMDDAHKYYKSMWGAEMQDLFEGKPDFERLIHPVTPEEMQRAYLVTNKYRLNPKIMREVDQEYGPLEWRLPDAHAVYWGEMGRRFAKPKDKEMDRSAIYQALAQACYQGRLTFISSNSPLIRPNFDIVEKTSVGFEKMISENTQDDNGYTEHNKTAHKNFLKTITFMLYDDGRTKEAEKWFNYLRKQYPTAVATNLNLDEYALACIGVQLSENEPKKMLAGIEGILRQAYKAIAVGEDAEADRAINYFNLAQKAWESFAERTQRSGQRLSLPPMETIKKAVLQEELDKYDAINPIMSAILRTRIPNAPPPKALKAAQDTNAPPAQ